MTTCGAEKTKSRYGVESVRCHFSWACLFEAQLKTVAFPYHIRPNVAYYRVGLRLTSTTRVSPGFAQRDWYCGVSFQEEPWKKLRVTCKATQSNFP